MKTVHLTLALAACGLLGAFALIAAGGSEQPKALPKVVAPAEQGKVAAEMVAPLLLDASLKVAAKQPAGTDNPKEQKDLVLPPPGLLHVTMDILVDGQPLPTVKHAGKIYLPVPHLGQEYHIRVWNHGPRRVAAVVSVDGLSVINGQPASEHGPGYLVAPYSPVIIKGWRQTLDHVAAFRFVNRDKSYANLVGKPENIGVIGLVAIEEKIVRPVPLMEKRESAPVAKDFRAAVGSIGTEYGREVDSRAYYVPFLRGDNKQKVTVYYDTVKALADAGIPVHQTDPVPFPGDLKFVPPPPGYKGK